MPRVKLYEGPAIRITQRNRQFCFLPVPSKKLAAALGFETLKWDPDSSAFAGFNREVDQERVKTIMEGIDLPSVIIPNPVIAYMLADSFEFRPNAGETEGIETGKALIYGPGNGFPGPAGFVIDGQHRVAALRDRELEEGEDDLLVGLITFHAPRDKADRVEFDEFVLEQMTIINNTKPLSDKEKQLVEQRRGTVLKALGNRPESAANLIIKDLDRAKDSPIQYRSLNKKPPGKGQAWLTLPVWVNLFTEVIRTQGVLREIFKGDFGEQPDLRTKAGQVLRVYLRAVKELVADKDYWEHSPQRQRLYHNVGLGAILSLMDEANRKAKVFSAVDPGKLKLKSEEVAVKAFKKAIKPLRLLDWSVGTESDGVDPLTSLKMAGIQKQKQIPEKLAAALKSFLDFCNELQEGEDTAEQEYTFEVRDSAGVPVCRERVRVSKPLLDQLDQQITDGDL